MKNNKAVILRSTKEDQSIHTDFTEFFKDYKEEDVIDLKNLIYRDTREKKGWIFPSSDVVEKTEITTLKTGDYTIKGYEKDFVIERKGSTSEFAQNIFESRFENELKRLDEFKLPFLICEFSYEDLVNFPINSGIPPKLWYKVKVSKKYLISAFMRYQVVYRTKFILAGKNGQDIAESLFKMVVRHAAK